MNAAIIFLLPLLISPALAGAPTVKGDPKALQEILATFNRVNAAKTYRMKGTIGGGPMVVEAVMPDRYHTRVESPDGKVFETVRVGSELRFQHDGQRWICAPAPPLSFPNTDLASLSDKIIAAKGPVATIDGTVTRSYTYTYPGQGYTIKLYVAIAEGLPKRVEVVDSSGAVESTLDYYDYGAPITIDLPACT
jgi:outer membrane lipoprotein-sorting protein